MPSIRGMPKTKLKQILAVVIVLAIVSMCYATLADKLNPWMCLIIQLSLFPAAIPGLKTISLS